MTRDEMLDFKLGGATLREQMGRIIPVANLADRIFDAFDGGEHKNTLPLDYRLKRAGEAVDDLRYMVRRGMRDVDVSIGLAQRATEPEIREHWIGDASRKAERTTEALKLLEVVIVERDKLAKTASERQAIMVAAE